MLSVRSLPRNIAVRRQPHGYLGYGGDERLSSLRVSTQRHVSGDVQLRSAVCSAFRVRQKLPVRGVEGDPRRGRRLLVCDAAAPCRRWSLAVGWLGAWVGCSQALDEARTLHPSRVRTHPLRSWRSKLGSLAEDDQLRRSRVWSERHFFKYLSVTGSRLSRRSDFSMKSSWKTARGNFHRARSVGLT